MVNETSTTTYDAAKVNGEYLKPLYVMNNDLLKISDILKMLPPLQKDEDFFMLIYYPHTFH